MTVEQTSITSSAATTAGWEDDALVLTRVFDAPREVVYRAWTDPEHFARWFGPHGSTMPYCEMDVRSGGILHFLHRFPDHEDVWVKGTYREVVAPERIVFDTHFSNEAGDRVDRPGFPQDMRLMVSFTELGSGTKVTIRQTGLVVDQGEVQGWIEGLDRLAEQLAGQTKEAG